MEAVPEAAAPSAATARLPVLEVDDEGLARGLRAHGIALKAEEVRSIAQRLGRDPTLVELHAFDAQWSEHCSYKSSRHYLARLPTTGPTVMQGPQEDAGVVHLGEWQGKRYGIVIAHESHNHPSQVVPFEGAATGVGGIVRDVLCMGARLIALADPLRFGPRDDPHSRYVAQGVVDGIAAYGNAIGVPTIAGDVYFHEGFRDNCLVNVVALGLLAEDEIIHSAAPAGSAGWDVVLVGKATDRSGFGGAAFSSLVLDEADAEANKGAVQVPNPFLKSVIMRASYRAFDVIRARGLTVGFKDLGAGGIMGCTAELAASGGFGARIDLDKCPASQPDLPAAVIAVGETQERLAWVVPPSFTPELLAIYNDEFGLPNVARGAQAAIVGTITEAKEYVLVHGGDEVMCVPIDFLTGGVRYDRACELPTPVTTTLAEAIPRVEPILETRERGDPADLRNRNAAADSRLPFDYSLPARILSHHDVCSRRAIYERYDSVVRGATSIPSGYADAGVIVPIPGSPLAAALAVDANPRYAEIDPGLAAEHAVCEAIRNVACVGARPVGLTDCLNFGDPENPRDFGAFVASVDGLARAARELSVPYVSGNVSLYNRSTNGEAIPPSPIVACVGAIADVSRTATMELKKAGNTLWLLGKFVEDEVGGSVLANLAGLPKTRLPRIDYELQREVLAFLLDGIASGHILSAHDVSDGGLFTAVAEMAFATRRGRRLGVAFDIDSDPCNPRMSVSLAVTFFGEHGGVVIEVDEFAWNDPAWEKRWSAMTMQFVGRVLADHLISAGDNGELPSMRWSLDELYEAWSAPLSDFYDEVPQA